MEKNEKVSIEFDYYEFTSIIEALKMYWNIRCSVCYSLFMDKYLSNLITKLSEVFNNENK